MANICWTNHTPFRNYTVSQKSSHLYTLCSLWLCQILTDFHIFALLESVWNLLQNPYETTHLTLGVLLYYLGKLIQISCRLSIVPVSHDVFNSLLTPHFVHRFSGNSSVNLFAVYPFKYKLFIKILSSSLNTMLIVDKHCSELCCDEFSVAHIDRNSK